MENEIPTEECPACEGTGCDYIGDGDFDFFADCKLCKGTCRVCKSSLPTAIGETGDAPRLAEGQSEAAVGEATSLPDGPVVSRRWVAQQIREARRKVIIFSDNGNYRHEEHERGVIGELVKQGRTLQRAAIGPAGSTKSTEPLAERKQDDEQP